MKVSALFADMHVTTSMPAAGSAADVDVTSLAYDSRRVQPGALFAAWRGEHRDGHDNISDAIERGAVAVLCERAESVPSEAGATMVVVDNSRRSLAHAARCFYGDPSSHMTMIGVTGTNGKTTTTHLIESMVQHAGRRAGVVGTLGCHYQDGDGTVVDVTTGFTTPPSVDLVELMVSMRDAGVDTVAMEVSSHAIDQERVGGVAFDVGVFTNLTHDHLDYHGTLDAYFAVKARLLSDLLKANGTAVLNIDDARVRQLSTAVSIDFSAAGDVAADVRVLSSTCDAQGIRATVATPAGELQIDSPLLGQFNLENLLATVAVGVALKFETSVIEQALHGIAAVPGRFERVSGAQQPLVVVDYAHTPDALAKALETMREVVEGKILCVFGCGGDRDVEKRGPMGEVAGRLADQTIVTNDNPRSEDPMLISASIEAGLKTSSPTEHKVILDRGRAIEYALSSATSEDGVLIAGKGHEDYQIIGLQTFEFDDRVEARSVLARLFTEGVICP